MRPPQPPRPAAARRSCAGRCRSSSARARGERPGGPARAGPGLRQEEGGRWCPSVVSNQRICEPAVARSITAHELGVVLRTMGGAKIKDSEVPTGVGVGGWVVCGEPRRRPASCVPFRFPPPARRAVCLTVTTIVRPTIAADVQTRSVTSVTGGGGSMMETCHSTSTHHVL